MNILDAIINITNSSVFKLKDIYISKNRANSMGDALEEYIKDVFAGTIKEDDDNIRNVKIKTPNNPSVLKGAKLITYYKYKEEAI